MMYNNIMKILLSRVFVILFSVVAIVVPVQIHLQQAEGRTTTITAAGHTVIRPGATGYNGTGWVRNSSGSGSTPLSMANCQAAGIANWAWFSDANGNGITSDPEDGECVKVVAVTPAGTSWNGALRLASTTLADTAATGGTSNTITTATTLTEGKYIGELIKINTGTAAGAWGLIKYNTPGTITLYGSWLEGNFSPYAAASSTPDSTSHFQIFNDNQYDNSFIGDYSCTGNFPSGTVVNGSYPSSGETSALATTDCYDGKRDLLPNVTDRAVISGTATAADSATITDTSQSLAVNRWMGQEVLITGGTGQGGYGIIESNTATVITVASWIGAQPAVGSAFKIIYILPRASYVSGTARIFGASDDASQNKGPLSETVLNDWKGTRLPTSMDFFGFCGAKNGDNYNTAGNSTYQASGAATSTAVGNYGSNVGRGKNVGLGLDNYMYLSNSGSWEWLSEQYINTGARFAGNSACSYIIYTYVSSGYRFRAVFRP